MAVGFDAKRDPPHTDNATRLAREAKQAAAETKATRSKPRDEGHAETDVGLEAALKARIDELAERLGQAAEDRYRELAARLQGETERWRQESEMRLSERIDELARELHASLAAGRRAVSARKGVRLPIEANQATLAELRGLGLSLTQASRVIEHRETLGGFSSLQQLDGVPGISKQLRSRLKRALKLPASGAGMPA